MFLKNKKIYNNNNNNTNNSFKNGKVTFLNKKRLNSNVKKFLNK